MPDIIVKNNLNPHKAVRFSVNIVKYVDKNANGGEANYYLEIGTTHSGIIQKQIPPVYIDNVENDNLDAALSEALGKLSSYIDWGPLLHDKQAPKIKSVGPIGEDVSIYSNVTFTIVDEIPSTGIDLSDMKVMLDNGVVTFDITDELTVLGDPFEYTFSWSPKIREIR